MRRVDALVCSHGGLHPPARRLMFDVYPKRIGQVLLVGAPLIFQPVWAVIKPLLGKYAALVQFVSPQEAEAYFGSPAGGVLR